MKRRIKIVLLAGVIAAATGACSLERGRDSVWRPGDPDPTLSDPTAPIIPGGPVLR